jgi:cyanophycin synthetase
VVLDLAHNEAGVAALVEVLHGLRSPGRAVRLVLGSPGDRTDEIIRGIGELGARGSDRAVIGHKDYYLRGRPREELAGLLLEGAAAVGVHDVPIHPTELAAVQALVAEAAPGDVVGVMCHAERVAIERWLAAEGATVDGPDEIRTKVLATDRPHPSP